jgi:hypothetical protein
MFYSGGKAKKQNVMNIINKKPQKNIVKNLPETFSNMGVSDNYITTTNLSTASSFDTTTAYSTTQSRSRSRTRSRSRSHSRSRKDDTSVFNSDDDDTAGTTEDLEFNGNEREHQEEDTTTYITTISNNETVLHYSYAFVDTELTYNLTDLEDEDILDFELVIYRINTLNKKPFLEFLLYYDKSFGKCTFPVYHKKRTSSQTLKMQIDEMMNKLFTTKHRYKGYMYDEVAHKCYIFYEKYFDINYRPFLVFLQDAINWYWICSTEIINHRQYLNIPIDDTVTDMFTEYPQIMLLQEQNQNIEVPLILYTGANFCYTETMSRYGLRREPITSRYGPFYYFTEFRLSFRWGCYDYKNKNIMITSELSDKYLQHEKTAEGEKYPSGGLTRYAVFPGRMKSVFIDDEYNVDVINRYKHNKSTFENISIPKNTNYMEYLDKSSSFHSYDYSWAKDYDTIYNGLYIIDKKQHSGKKDDYDVIKPFWCVYDYKQFEQLTYYCIDTTKIPDTYDLSFENYTIL